MLKTTVLPRVVISSDEVMHQRTDITLMSYDKNVHQIKIPTDLTEGEINRVLVIFTFPLDESVIQFNGSWVDGHIQFTLPEILRTQRGDFHIEVNIDLIDSQITFARYRAKVVKSDIDANTNHVASVYFELFEDFVNEVADDAEVAVAEIDAHKRAVSDKADTAITVITDAQAEFDSLYAEKSQMMDTLHDDKKADMEVLEADYSNRANTLEATYVPRLTEVSAQLAQKATYSEVNSLLGNISEGTPLFSETVEGMTNTSRVYVNTSDGYLYVHNGSYWENTNQKYQATGLSDDSVGIEKLSDFLKEGNKLNLINHATISKTPGYYINGGSLVNDPPGAYFTTDYIPVTPGKRYYVGDIVPSNGMNVSLWEDIGVYQQNIIFTIRDSDTTASGIIPAGAKYVKVIVREGMEKNTWCVQSDTDIFLEQPVTQQRLSLTDENSVMRGTYQGILGPDTIDDLVNKVKYDGPLVLKVVGEINRGVISQGISAEYDLSSYVGETVELVVSYDLYSEDESVNGGQVKIYNSPLSRQGDYTGRISDGAVSPYVTGEIITYSHKIAYSVPSDRPKLVAFLYALSGTVEKKEYTIYPRVTVNGSRIDDLFEGAYSSAGENVPNEISSNNPLAYSSDNRFVSAKLLYEELQNLEFPEQEDSINHWDGKTWHAFGTSMTSTQQGKYVPVVQSLSGLNVINHGIPGGSITGNIYNTILNVPQNIDLVTLEAGPNNFDTPLGEFGDRTSATFYGALDMCFKHLTKNTRARVVAITIHPSRYSHLDSSVLYDGYQKNQFGDYWRDYANAIKEVAEVYSVPVIDGYAESGLGATRLTSDTLLDQIHQSALGGKIFGEYVWSKLKDITPNRNTL